MAEITKRADGVSLSSSTPNQDNLFSELVAGENLDYGDAVTVHSDGKVYLANGTTDNANAKVFGFVAKKTRAGKSVTMYLRVRFAYMDQDGNQAQVPGTLLYLSATVPGGLATTAPFSGAPPVAFVLTEGRIQTEPNWSKH